MTEWLNGCMVIPPSHSTIQPFSHLTMLAYLLETTICWAVFYLLYHWLLGRETFFSLNRWYLLGTAALGLIIPALDLNALFFTPDEPATFYLPVITIGTAELKTVVVGMASEKLGWQATFTCIYWLGATVALGKFGYGFFQIVRLRRQGEISRGNGYRFVATQHSHAPFSFFNHIFWSRKFQTSEEDRRIILRHEEAHIFQRHSLDVLFFELLGVIFWCSPPIYFYKKALKTTHEYLADNYVLASENKKQYGRLLLRQSQSGMQVAISNSLFHSQLKQRIVMMSKLKSPQRASLKYLAALPLLALLCLAFSFDLPLAKAQSPAAPDTAAKSQN
ncbi:MAG: M56 family metallopeptidase, partial [Bacteroidota bacterium]